MSVTIDSMDEAPKIDLSNLGEALFQVATSNPAPGTSPPPHPYDPSHKEQTCECGAPMTKSSSRFFNNNRWVQHNWKCTACPIARTETVSLVR